MRSPQTEPATPKGFYGYTDDPLTGTICAELADMWEQRQRGELSAEDYKTAKQQKKIGAHFYTPHAHFKKGYKSGEGEPVDSGKAIIDLDGCENFPEIYAERLMGREQQLGINMVNRSISGSGGHVLFDIPEGLTRQEAQAWMAHELGDVEYDKAVHEKERGIYIPCREYILYIDEERMFGDELRAAELSEEEIEKWKGQKQGQKQGQAQGQAQGRTGGQSLCNSVAVAPCSQQGQSPSAPSPSAPSPSAPTPGAREPSVREPTARALAVFDEALVMTGLTLAQLNQDGVRHNTLKLLLPTLCQMMPHEELLGVLALRMPEYSKEEDCLRLVGNFYEKYVDPNRPMSLQQREVFLRSLKASDDPAADEAMPQVNSFAINIRQLPIGLKESLKPYPEKMWVPILIGLMPAAMALADRVQVRYCDGKLQWLGGMAIIIGEQASNKSVVKDVVELWLAGLRYDDELVREAEDQVKEHNKTRKANEKAKSGPDSPIRVVPITISCSTLLKRLKRAKGHCIYSICEEIDTLRKSNSAGSWSAKYDVYRNSFDRAIWGQDFNSDQAESGEAPVAYNWTILGTEESVMKCFNTDNAKNGLSGRMMLSEMPENLFAKISVFKELSDADRQRIEEATHILQESDGFYDTPRLRKTIDDWLEEKRVEAAMDADKVKDVFRRRAGVIGFRCGVVFMLLFGKESNVCLDYARMIAEYTLQEQIKVFGPVLTAKPARGKEPRKSTSTKNGNIFQQLPSPFSMDQLRLLKGAEFADSSLASIVSRWKSEGWVEKDGKNKWKKLKY